MEEIKKALQLIRAFYGNRTTARSKVPLMNHINEGYSILVDHYRTKNDEAVAAYIIHPLVQNDEDFENNIALVASTVSRATLVYVLEYRNVANRHLLEKVGQPIKLSVIPEVNLMLKADKIQNYKDFRKYHLGTHEKSAELEQYFEEWLAALNVSKERFLQIEQKLWLM